MVQHDPMWRTLELMNDRTRRITCLPLSIILAGLSTGCEKASRLCVEFNHPLAQEFSTVAVGGSMMFSSSLGDVITYRLESVVNNQPYTSSGQSGHWPLPVIDGGSPNDIECDLESEHTYVSPEFGTALLLKFKQFDTAEVPPEDQSLRMRMIVSDSDSRPGSGFDFLLSDQTREYDYPGDGVMRYYENKLFGQTEYTDVSEFIRHPGHFVFESDAQMETRLSRMAISKGTGMVEFEQADGVVYTRIPP